LAEQAYHRGLEMDPGNQGLEEALDRIDERFGAMRCDDFHNLNINQSFHFILNIVYIEERAKKLI